MRAARALVVGGVVAAGWACAESEPRVALGLTSAPDANLLRVIEAVIDSTHRPGWPRIELVEADSVLVTGRDDYVIQAVGNAVALAARPEVVAAIGPEGSQDAILVGPVYRDAGLAFVLPTANSPQLAAIGIPAFRLAPTVEEEAAVIAEFAVGRLRARAATVFYDPGPWGIALQAAVTTELWFRGIRVLGQFPVPGGPGCLARGDALDHIAEAGLQAGRPDVIVLATHEGASSCLTAGLAVRLPDAAFVAGDGTVLTGSLLNRLGAARSRFYAVTFWSPLASTPEVNAFRRLMEATAGRAPTYHDAVTFDAAMILVEAIREAGADRSAVLRYLERLRRSRRAYQGVSGPITFDGRGRGRVFVQAASDVAFRGRSPGADLQ